MNRTSTSKKEARQNNSVTYITPINIDRNGVYDIKEVYNYEKYGESNR